VERYALLPVRGARCGEACLDAGFVHDVDMVEGAADRLGMGLACFIVDVENGNLHARIGKGLRARLAKAARPAGHHRRHARFDLHGCTLLMGFSDC